MSEVPDAETMKAFNKNIVDEFRANGGKVGGQFEGGHLLLLSTTGAKSGQPRIAPLAYFTIDGKTIIIGSKAGADTNPDWVPPANCRRPNATRSSTRSSPRHPVSASTSRRPAESSRCSSCSEGNSRRARMH